jgi:hypothetical protein
MRPLFPTRQTWPFSLIGALLLSLFAWQVPIAELGGRLHDWAFPVVIGFNVTEKRLEGGDLVISGYMVKQRDCVFLPPTIARDDEGTNYPVESASRLAGKTWPRSDQPQHFGPWRVRGVGDRRLQFFNVYDCGGAVSVAILGTVKG